MRALIACFLVLTSCTKQDTPPRRAPVELTHPAAAVPMARPVLHDLDAQKQQAHAREQVFEETVEANR